MHEHHIHIAYADDHVVVRKGIIAILQSLGGIVVDADASNGRELIERLEALPRLPHICMLDINMPVMNGFDTIVALKKRWPALRILVLTIFETEHYIIRMIRNGANGYLLKSCDPDEIKRALTEIHQYGSYHSTQAPVHFTRAIQQNLIRLPSLTEKEATLLKYACTDLTYAEIAVKMKTTPRSVEGYRDSIFKKLQVSSRVGLALYAVQAGLVPLEIGASPTPPPPEASSSETIT